jgi:hypothetical protein
MILKPQPQGDPAMNTTTETPQDALARIQAGASQNDLLAEAQFRAAGFTDPVARVNILTYRAWQALGRQVTKGQKGVKVPVFGTTTDAEGETRRYCRTVALFHIDQTQPI